MTAERPAPLPFDPAHATPVQHHQIRAGARALRKSATLPLRAFTLADTDAVLLAQQARGGGRVLVAADETMLFSASAVPEAEHVERFLAGERTAPEAFAAPLVDTVVPVGRWSLRFRSLPGLDAGITAVSAAFGERADDLRDGYRVQLGWGPFGLHATGPDSFDVSSPNYPGYVSRGGGTDDLTLALWSLTAQVALLRTLDLEGSDLIYDERVIVAKRALDAPLWIMVREHLRPGDSGWFVDAFGAEGADRLTAEEMVAYPVAELLHVRREAAAALLLPPGYAVSVTELGIDTIVRQSDGVVLARRQG